MGIVIADLPQGVTKVILDGRLDIQGAEAIDLQMNIVASSRRAVLVDLEQVTFLASMGLRTLVSAAQTLKMRGGRMCLFRPNDLVEQVLVSSGVDKMIPVAHQFDQATTALLVAADSA